MTFRNPLDNPDEFHFMVDIETLAIHPHAKVTEIGAAGMSYTEGHLNFFAHCWDRSGEEQPATIKWREENNLPWKNKNEALDLYAVLQDFSNWIKKSAGTRTPIFWCKGTDFDAVILGNKFKWYQMEVPWKYNNIRDMRTLLSLFPEYQTPKDQVVHHGLHDAIAQRNQVRSILKDMQNGVNAIRDIEEM
jgi:3'-5' exoribonuclease-like protein